MTTSKISVAAARRDFARVLSRAAHNGTRIKVRRYGTTLAGIVSAADLAKLEECDSVLTTRRAKRPSKRSLTKRRRRSRRRSGRHAD